MKEKEKADVLIEAMPYIQAFRGESMTIKFGGSVMEDRAAFNSILTDTAFLETVGLRPIIVHGGGKAISKKMQGSGIKSEFVNGLRVTDANAIKVVEEVLNHEVNVEIVETLNSKGAKAAGLHGPSIFKAERLLQTNEKGEKIDIGFVGKITEVDIGPLLACMNAGLIPVVTPLGKGKDGIYNINADESAAAVAREIKARKLIFLSDVPGILLDQKDISSVISTIRRKEVDELIEKGIIYGGMLPKIQGALDALDSGVKKVHIIDGHLPHSLLLEIFTDKGIGTEIIKDE
jgi:acetylglutamate kinase